MCKKHKIRSAFILAFFLITIPTLIYGHANEWLHFYHDSVETLSFMSVIVSTIFVAYQIFLFLRDYRQKHAHSEFETAYKLAGYYSKNIIPSLNAAEFHLRRINKKIAPDYNKKASKFKEFTAKEAKELFGDDILEKFFKEFSDYKNFNYPRYEFLLNSTPTTETTKKIPTLVNGKPSNPKVVESVQKRADYLKEQAFIANQHITFVLNNIEYFSMYFCSGLASSETVYPSLHQTFCDIVIDSYLLICYMNSQPGHELYIHTTTLYNEWTAKSLANHEHKKQQAKKMPET